MKVRATKITRQRFNEGTDRRSFLISCAAGRGSRCRNTVSFAPSNYSLSLILSSRSSELTGSERDVQIFLENAAARTAQKAGRKNRRARGRQQLSAIVSALGAFPTLVSCLERNGDGWSPLR